MGYIVILILPVAMTLIVNKFSQKLLFLVPLVEFGIVSLFNTFIYTARGAGFDKLGLMIGTMITVILALILLSIEKQHALLILGIVVGLFILFILLDNTLELFHKDFFIWILPSYVGVVALTFQKHKESI